MSRGKSLLTVAALPVLGVILAVARWLTQGSGNVYTDLGRRLFVPDPVLGWRIADTSPVWLGLDVIGGLVAVAAAVLVAAVLVMRRERRGRRHLVWPRTGLGVIGAACLVVPVWAFASGGAPAGARDVLPGRAVEPPREGITGHLASAPPGRYAVVEGKSSLVVAHLSAGGEAFEASFSALRGTLTGDPGDLHQPLTAHFELSAASVDTGIDLRSKHAREYLQVEKYPRIGFSLTELSATRQHGADEIAFSARGDLSFMGGVHHVPIAGTMTAVKPADRARLGLGDSPALIVNTELTVTINKTPLAPDAGDFDGPTIPISVTLVLTHQPQGTNE